MFLDDTPAYPAAFFGAVRAGFVPLLINTLTPPDLLQFYLSDSGATRRRGRCRLLLALRQRRLRGYAVAHADRGQRRGGRSCRAECARGRADGCTDFAAELAEADTHRNEMAFWMYSSGSTGRPKGIVHLQHDMAYSEAAFARNVLQAGSRRHLLLGAENLLRLRVWQFDHLPVLGRRGDPAAAGPAKAVGDFRGDRALSTQRVLRIADALYFADQGRGRGGDRFLLAADGAVGRRGALGRRIQRLEEPDRPRNRRGAGLDRGAAHLSLQPPGAEKARRRGPARARL